MNHQLKQSLRTNVRSKRQRLMSDNSYKQMVNSAVFGQLTTLSLWQTPQVVHTYLAKEHEIDTRPIIEWLWQQNHEVWGSHLPRQSIANKFVKLLPTTQYETDRYGAPLPLGKAYVSCRPTVVLVPALAADQSGIRLGQGGGWYDRFLRTHPEALRICLIGDDFLLEKLPHESHDQTLDLIVTNTKIIHTKRV